MWFTGDAGGIGGTESSYSITVFLWSGFSSLLLMVEFNNSMIQSEESMCVIKGVWLQTSSSLHL